MKQQPRYLVFSASLATVLAVWWFGVLGHLIARDGVSIALGVLLALNLAALAEWFVGRR